MATILDSLVGSCAKKLQEMITEEAILLLGVKEELTEMQRTMKYVQCVLNGAEQRSIEDSVVDNWLGDLRNAMYDADDIIDLARFEGSKLLEDHPSSSSSRKSIACPGLSFFSCIPNVRRRHEIAVQIRSFNIELEKISKLGERFLKSQIMQPISEVSAPKTAKSCPLVEPNLVGTKILHACTDLVKQFLKNKAKKSYKLGIVGMGGVGKTTLAQKIHNDHRIKGTFTKQAWICVSNKYSQVDLLKEILRNFGVRSQEQGETESELQKKLAEEVEDTSFFLVLDDVWQPEVWTNLLRTPLHAAANGMILVTTRRDTVLNTIGVDHVHRVELMSHEVGWELLWKSMNINEEAQVQNLRGIGMEIVGKCGGLPLAIKVIASVLAAKEKTENQWRQVINKSAWTMSKLPTELRGALYLSYDELPHYLKQCFLYCALYQEDQKMYRDDLIRLWVAEGFIEEQEGQLLEDTAIEYYYELINRNLLEPVNTRSKIHDLTRLWVAEQGRQLLHDRTIDYYYESMNRSPLELKNTYFNHASCKMHDLLWQLARHLSGEESFCGDPGSLKATTFSKLRRVSVVNDKDCMVLPNAENEYNRARTLLIRCAKPPRVENTIFRILPRIRVLDLTNSFIQSIPDYIGGLLHLRLLDLDGTDIHCLPDSIGSLINLRILNLQRCEALHSLPLAITKLCKLRRLGLGGTNINQVPKGIGKLKYLNDLEGFPICGGSGNAKKQDGWMLEELGDLSQLRKLEMIKLERAAACNTDSLLLDKMYLKDLDLCCTKEADEPYSEEHVSNIEKIFEQLVPPHSLDDLSIWSFFGNKYPTWLGTTHLSSLKHLTLVGCQSCAHLPSVGQLPNLKHLRIDGATAITKIGPEFIGCGASNLGSTEAVAFPMLEHLYIQNMPNWEEWYFVKKEENEAAAEAKEGGENRSPTKQKGESLSPRLRLLPRLNKLVLIHCPKLRALPWQLGQEVTSMREQVEGLLFLEKLWVTECFGLERVSNLPKLRELRAQVCPNLWCVEELTSLQQLWLAKDMQEISSLWVPGLQRQHRQLYGQDLDVYAW